MLKVRVAGCATDDLDKRSCTTLALLKINVIRQYFTCMNLIDAAFVIVATALTLVFLIVAMLLAQFLWLQGRCWLSFCDCRDVAESVFVVAGTLLTVWRADEHLQDLLREGRGLKIYNISTAVPWSVSSALFWSV